VIDDLQLPDSYDPHLALLKRKELELLTAKLAVVKANGIEYYRPHEKQHAFHASSAPRRGLFAGNRFGKSESSTAETVAWFLGERRWYKHKFPIYGIRDGKKVVVDFHDGHENHPLVRQGIPQRATKQLVITTDWKKVDMVWTSVYGDPPGKLWKFLPASEETETRKNHEGVIDRVYHKVTGAIIRFDTEQAFIKNPQSGESTDYDRIAVDEPILEDMWKAHSRGLVDRNGQGDFTLTGLRERWIYDKFFDEADEDTTEISDVRRVQKANYFGIRATMHDNPYLTKEAKDLFLEGLTDEERSCREAGLPLELSGLVYKEFDRQRHVLKELPAGWTSWSNPPPEWTIYVAVDVHSQTPQAVMFVAVPPMGVPIVYHEIWRPCVADVLCEEITAHITGRSVGWIKADPKAWEEDPVYRVSMASRFFAHGLFIEKASKAKDFGIQNMRSVLNKRTLDPASGRERPAVYFAPTVKQTLREISRYCYDKENKPVDKDDHFMECMYRMFIAPMVNIGSQTYIPTDAQPEITMSARNLRDFDEDMKAFNRSTDLSLN
jgi:hypothetical protein